MRNRYPVTAVFQLVDTGVPVQQHVHQPDFGQRLFFGRYVFIDTQQSGGATQIDIIGDGRNLVFIDELIRRITVRFSPGGETFLFEIV